MPEIPVELSTAQLMALRRLDPAPVKVAVQAHVDAWLAPLVVKAREDERLEMIAAYDKADPMVQARIRKELGVG